eukprot:1184148-Prorocentrum_minimum.AAC.2
MWSDVIIYGEADRRACDVSRAQGESNGGKRGTGQRGEKRGRVSGVLRAPLPLLAQEAPYANETSIQEIFGVEVESLRGLKVGNINRRLMQGRGM